MSVFRLLCVGLSSALLSPASASQIAVTVADGSGAFVSNAVIALFAAPEVAAPKPLTRGGPAHTATLDQLNKQFVPHVLAIQTGTALTFPNSDNIRHQVYSFSDAKRFELKLYSGRAAPPVVFDTPGVVVLGCNIHDWMSAYLYVVDTPYFALTDANGYVAIEAPAGRYTLKIWHPRHERGREPLVTSLQVTATHEQSRQVLPLAATDDSSGLPPSGQSPGN